MTEMETKATEILGFAPSALWVTLGVLVAVGIIVKLVFDLIIKARELRKPHVRGEKSIQDKLTSDNKRLCELEEVTKQQDEELKLILRGMMAMCHHMVDGNNSEALKETQKDIEEYLITGKVKKGA